MPVNFNILKLFAYASITFIFCFIKTFEEKNSKFFVFDLPTIKFLLTITLNRRPYFHFSFFVFEHF